MGNWCKVSQITKKQWQIFEKELQQLQILQVYVQILTSCCLLTRCY